MTQTNQHISIFGCGWLGLALGKHLVKNNFNVCGSTTSLNKINELNTARINAYNLDVNDFKDNQLAEFLNADVFIFCIPPSKVDLSKLNFLLEKINESPIKIVVLISSTGVYADSNSTLNEENGLAFLNKTSLVYQVENAFKSNCKKSLTILQLGGLVGPERHPSKFISSSKVLSNPNGRINFIIRDDVIKIIENVIVQNILNETFICVADQHPTKKEYYTAICAALSRDKPTFESTITDSFKIMDNQKIKRKLNFEFSDITKI